LELLSSVDSNNSVFKPIHELFSHCKAQEPCDCGEARIMMSFYEQVEKLRLRLRVKRAESLLKADEC